MGKSNSSTPALLLSSTNTSSLYPSSPLCSFFSFRSVMNWFQTSLLCTFFPLCYWQHKPSVKYLSTKTSQPGVALLQAIRWSSRRGSDPVTAYSPNPCLVQIKLQSNSESALPHSKPGFMVVLTCACLHYRLTESHPEHKSQLLWLFSQSAGYPTQ